jgi:opacity protein-like surface antigen
MPYSLTARVGLTYHPGWRGAPPAAVLADLPLGSWDGVYAGVQAGLTFLDSTERYDPSASNSDSKWDFSGHGASFGGHVGINRQVGMWVAGLEGDGAMQTDSFPYIRDEVSGKQTWSASVRARLGVLTAHNLLFYGTVGWAAAGFDYSRYFNPASAYAGTRFTAQAIQFGGGMEAFIARNVSARLEALYTNYGDHRIRYQGDPQKLVNPRNLEARVGVTYHFK